MLTNVLHNATQAIHGAGDEAGPGQVRVSVAVLGGQYVIAIDDNGPGIPPEVRQTLFDPYVTTKRNGTGLGLSIVKKIVIDHGGNIEAVSGPLGGARIRITLPPHGSPDSRAALEQSESDPESGREG